VAEISAPEAALILGVHKPQVYRAIKEGHLPYRMENGSPRLEREGLEDAWKSVPRRETGRRAPGAGRKPRSDGASTPPQSGGGTPPGVSGQWAGPVPDFNAERAWTESVRKEVELEKARGLRLKNNREAGLLVDRRAHEMAAAAVLGQLQVRAESVHLQIKLDIPELTFEQLELIETRIRNIFQDVADMDFEDLPEDIEEKMEEPEDENLD
jgi:excisionase family DNA binding protein